MSPFAAQRSPSSNMSSSSPKKVSPSVLEPLLSFWFYFKQRASKASKKLSITSPKSPLSKPRQLLTTISNKTFNFRDKKKSTYDHDHDNDNYDFGDGGLWQRSILMGDKCQPLDFSGVIYYDHDGKQLSELPMKSPARASTLPNNIKKED